LKEATKSYEDLEKEDQVKKEEKIINLPRKKCPDFEHHYLYEKEVLVHSLNEFYRRILIIAMCTKCGDVFEKVISADIK